MEGLDIIGIHLKIFGTVPDIDAEEFASITKVAKKSCIISKALKIPITSEVHLE
jgi:lipoyl-dependent peroxiredoxin